MSKVRIGIIGSRFQADCIAGAVKAMPEEGELVAVASPTKGHAAGFAKRHGIPRAYTDYRELLRDADVELISITAPNRVHAQITIDAARPASTWCARSRCAGRSKKPTRGLTRAARRAACPAPPGRGW